MFVNAKEISTQRSAHKHLKRTKSKEHATQTKQTYCMQRREKFLIDSELSKIFSQCTCLNNQILFYS